MKEEIHHRPQSKKPEVEKDSAPAQDLEATESKTPNLDGLLQENEELKAKSAEYLDSLQRERANFTNYKRRIDQENATINDRTLADLVKIFLPVLDDLERALKNKPENTTDAQWIGGIELIVQKLSRTLEGKGLIPIEVIPGDQFDPRFHEAVTHEENDNFNDGQIIEVVQTGYKLKDYIIRPALVRVAK